MYEYSPFSNWGSSFAFYPGNILLELEEGPKYPGKPTTFARTLTVSWVLSENRLYVSERFLPSETRKCGLQLYIIYVPETFQNFPGLSEFDVWSV